VAAQVAEGLYRAHSHVPSIVHRDVKPENLYLHRIESSFESVVKVMDFGVAAVVGESDPRSIGTPRYMAPEQVTGEHVSPQTDQYALALVVYEMLTGRDPWDVDRRDAGAWADAHRRMAPWPASRFCPWLPPGMDTALLKALSRDPRARHDTVHGLIFELRGLQWVSDRSSVDTGDLHSTDPMMGTLAEGALVLPDDHDTIVRMTAPPTDGADAEAAAPTGASSISVHVSAVRASAPSAASASFPREDAISKKARRLTLEAPDGGGERSEGAERGARLGLPSLDTPMTGESGRGSELSRREGLSRTTTRRAWAFAGPAAILVALLSAAVAGSSRGTGRKSTQPVETMTAVSTRVAAGESVSERAAPSVAESSQAWEHPTEFTVPAWLAAHDPTVAGAASVQPAPGPGVSAVGKAAALRSQPAVRSTPAKARTPDDGRDDLYVPVGR
jgi:hypothetical protein